MLKERVSGRRGESMKPVQTMRPEAVSHPFLTVEMEETDQQHTLE